MYEPLQPSLMIEILTLAAAGAEEEAPVTSVVVVVPTVEIPTSTARDVPRPAMEVIVAAVEVPTVVLEVPAADVVVLFAGAGSRTGKEP